MGEGATVEKNKKILEFVSDIRKLRVDIDYCIQFAKKSQHIKPGTVKQLEMGKGWFGKMLHYLEQENPYKQVDDPKDIPSTVDVHEGEFSCTYSGQPDKDRLICYNFLREKIKVCISVAELLNRRTELTEAAMEHSYLIDCWANGWSFLHNASMELGFHLQELREMVN